MNQPNLPDLRGPSPEDAAADWLARRHAGLTADEAMDFDRWLHADRRHADAFAELERVWRALNTPRTLGATDRALADLAGRRRRRLRRRAWIGGTVTVALAVVLLGFFLPGQMHDRSHAPGTIAVRPNLQRLPDGSLVELNSGAELRVAFSETNRYVHLLRGEGLFQVAHEAARPFVISAGHVEVRAIGTAFSVRHDAQAIDVLVTEGRVSVARRGDSEQPGYAASDEVATIVDAGHRITVAEESTAAGPIPLTAEDIRLALAWRDQRIEFSGTPLIDAVELFNQRNRLQLDVPDRKTRARRIDGVFWSNDPEGFVRLLEAALNIQAETTEGRIILREW